MTRFLLWLIHWLRSQRLRKQLYERPYFWGTPDDHMAYIRYEAFKTAIGHPDADRDTVSLYLKRGRGWKTMQDCVTAKQSARTS